MASGHVNRIQRPNTWQHRPSLRREESSCQPGAVHTWHFSEVATLMGDVRCWGRGLRRGDRRELPKGDYGGANPLPRLWLNFYYTHS